MFKVSVSNRSINKVLSGNEEKIVLPSGIVIPKQSLVAGIYSTTGVVLEPGKSCTLKGGCQFLKSVEKVDGDPYEETKKRISIPDGWMWITIKLKINFQSLSEFYKSFGNEVTVINFKPSKTTSWSLPELAQNSYWFVDVSKKHRFELRQVGAQRASERFLLTINECFCH